jgi:hypothetical protein
MRNCLRITSVVCLLAIYVHAQSAPRVVHVFVALADNKYQGIVPVPAALGNGDDPGRNLYWGAGGGVKTFLARSKEWQLVSSEKYPRLPVLERCIFKYRTANVYLVADAYQGAQIRQATIDFLNAAAGGPPLKIGLMSLSSSVTFNAGGSADVIVYVGHDGLMDFSLPNYPRNQNKNRRETIILACASKQYFTKALRAAGATPLLWTTNLMAPEAYTLKAALDGWIVNEKPEQIRQRAAEAYSHYQKCSVKAARGLLVAGW